MSKPVHVALYEGLADWEAGHLLAELHTGRFTRTPLEVVTVGESTRPVTSMGGLRLVPELARADLDPADSALLILPGATSWTGVGNAAFATTARRFLDLGVPVAAICGAVEGLARAGLLDGCAHTGAAPQVLAATGYAGAGHYVDRRAVIDGDLVTAGPQSPVQFATAVLERLGLATAATLDAYEAVLHRGDPSGYPALAASGAA